MDGNERKKPTQVSNNKNVGECNARVLKRTSSFEYNNCNDTE